VSLYHPSLLVDSALTLEALDQKSKRHAALDLNVGSSDSSRDGLKQSPEESVPRSHQRSKSDLGNMATLVQVHWVVIVYKVFEAFDFI